LLVVGVFLQEKQSANYSTTAIFMQLQLNVKH